MSNKLTDAQRSLERAQESARQRLVEIEQERREIKASIKSLEAAINALGRSKRKPPSKPSAAIEPGITNETCS